MHGTMSLRNEAQRGKGSTLQGRNAPPQKKPAPNSCSEHIQVPGTVVICSGVVCSPCWKVRSSQRTSTEQHFKPLAAFLRVAVRPWCSGQILGIFFLNLERKNTVFSSHFYSFFHFQCACVLLKQLLPSPVVSSEGRTEHGMSWRSQTDAPETVCVPDRTD